MICNFERIEENIRKIYDTGTGPMCKNSVCSLCNLPGFPSWYGLDRFDTAEKAIEYARHLIKTYQDEADFYATYHLEMARKENTDKVAEDPDNAIKATTAKAEPIPNAMEIKKFDPVTKPSHYNFGEIEVIDYIKDKLTPTEMQGYCTGNVLKYVSRWRHKDGLQDLEKAQVYLGWLIDSVKKERFDKLGKTSSQNLQAR